MTTLDAIFAGAIAALVIFALGAGFALALCSLIKGD